MARFVFEDKSVYYEEYGEGRPIVVLNGIMMSCASWSEFVEPFSANNRLILLDMLDQGRNESMDGPYSQAIQVEVVLALLDHLNLDKVCLMGISYGSEVALRFAIKYGERVERLALFNATARTGPWLKDIGDAWNLAARDPDAYYLTTIPVIYSPGFYRDNNAWMNRRRKALKPVFSNPKFINAMIRLTNSSADYDVSDRLDKITAPTLVVSCTEDYLTPMAEQQFIAEHIPDCHYVVIPGCGHASMYEKPVLFASLTLGFFNNPKLKFNIL
ncbi:MAG: alpha/beta fold hydrolase [Candidatus Enterenecus sp.]